MSAEGDRRPGVLENNHEQHIRIPTSETETSESQEMSTDIPLDTRGSILEKAGSIMLYFLGIFIGCSIFLILIYGLVQTVGSLGEKFVGFCPVNGTFQDG